MQTGIFVAIFMADEEKVVNVKKILISVSTLVAVFLTGSASALVIDFAGMADTGVGVGSIPYGERGGQPITLDNTYQTSLGSLVINAYGYTISSSGKELERQQAYLDKGNAGMGVCQTASSCAGNSDDNVTDDEVLELHFNQLVTITGISFVNGHHGDHFDSEADFGLSVYLSVGSHTPGVYSSSAFSPYDLTANFDALSFTSGLGYSGTDFLFSNTNGSNTDEYVYYVNAMTIKQVPEPGLLLLVVTGLVGVIAARRRRIQL
ncbi:MAG: hypothetical protein BMS9Abin25_0793 [Gammaproteobacteria bacterium]|nr:MAG: hypothetical protein BMS9Abin25_0793 [Gammaproteobacteria bacterium]